MKRYLAILSLTLILLASVQYSRAQGRDVLAKAAESLLVDAVQDYDNGDLDSATRRLGAILAADPDNDAAHYYLALCSFYSGDNDAALKQMREAVRLDPGNYWYRDRLAVMYTMTGDDGAALKEYESLLVDFPKKSEIYYNLVNLYAQTGDMDKVLSTLDAIETFSGKDESTTVARYDVLMRQDRAEEAFRALEAYNEEFSSPQILSMMGDAMAAMDRDSLAITYYREALALEPDYAPAMLGEAELYRLKRSYDDFFSTLNRFVTSPSIPSAMKGQYLDGFGMTYDARFAQNFQPQLDSLYEAAVRMHPADSSLVLPAASYYFRSERRDRALELFKSNAEAYPDNLGARATYVQAISLAEDWTSLLEACEEAFGDFPGEPGFLNMKVLAYYNLDDSASMIEECNRMIGLFPSDTSLVLQSYSTIGDSWHQLGDEKQAFKAYDKALKIDPNYAPVLNNYAYYLSLKNKKLGKAFKMSYITVEQEPDNATYLDTFAWILHLQHKDQDAKTFFKRAMIYGGRDSAVMLDHYAEVLFALKEYDLAKVYWDQARGKNKDNEIPDLEERIEVRMKSIGK